MKNKAVMSIFVLATIALLGVSMVSAFSGMGNGMMNGNLGIIYAHWLVIYVEQ